jgi:hypothetical protein
MRQIIATGVVFFAVLGVAAPSWAGPALAEPPQHAALTATAAGMAAVHRPAGHHALVLPTRAETRTSAGLHVPSAAAPLPVSRPATPNAVARQEPRSDDTDRSNTALMLLIALGMLVTVFVKGGRA